MIKFRKRFQSTGPLKARFTGSVSMFICQIQQNLTLSSLYKHKALTKLQGTQTCPQQTPLKKKKKTAQIRQKKKKRFKQPFSLRNSLNVYVEIWARKKTNVR